MPDPTEEARELAAELRGLALYWRSYRCDFVAAEKCERAASFISRTAQPQGVTTEMVERALRADEIFECFPREHFWVVWNRDTDREEYFDDEWPARRRCRELNMHASLTAALQVNPPAPSQGGR